jgi:LacI family transcriptional regulator, repressor for deo operon, udp, cdd, tsx, nupC, and nupG
MATILDVSKAAGVSVATVSRVLNDKGRVSLETAQRVREAVEALHYAPNVSARNLRLNESRIILIVAPNITNPYYTHILAGISKAAHRTNYSAFQCNTEGDRKQTEKVLDMLVRRQADGAILLATERSSDWLRPYADKYPLVECSEYDPQLNLPRVSIDNYAAAREAMAHLIWLGHERIGLVSSSNQYISTVLRLKGYRDALKEANLPLREDYVLRGAADYSFKSGFDSAKGLLELNERPTALLCISDMLALGAIASAKELGLRVPEDVTVVGFDDVEHTTMFHPHVTTVAQPCIEIGEKAMELLESAISHAPLCQETLLPHRLIVRESSAPPSGPTGLLKPVSHNKFIGR